MLGSATNFFLKLEVNFISEKTVSLKKKYKNYFVTQSLYVLSELLYPALTLYEPSVVKITNKISKYFSMEEKSF